MNDKQLLIGANATTVISTLLHLHLAKTNIRQTPNSIQECQTLIDTFESTLTEAYPDLKLLVKNLSSQYSAFLDDKYPLPKCDRFSQLPEPLKRELVVMDHCFAIATELLSQWKGTESEWSSQIREKAEAMVQPMDTDKLNHEVMLIDLVAETDKQSE